MICRYTFIAKTIFIISQTARKASIKRADNLLASFNTIPNPELYGKHRSCYSKYTNIENLKHFESTESKDNQSSIVTRQVEPFSKL